MNKYLKNECETIQDDICMLLEHNAEPEEIQAKVDYWTLPLDLNQKLQVMLYISSKFKL